MRHPHDLPSDSSSGDHTRSDHVRSDTTEAVGAIPALVGFPPTRSLVVLWFDEDDDVPRSFVIHPLPIDQEQLPEVTAFLERSGSRSGVTSAIAVVIDGTASARSAHAPVICAVAALCATLGISLTDAVWVPTIESGTVWRSYIDPTMTGELPSAATPVFAAGQHGTVGLLRQHTAASAMAAESADILDYRAALISAIRDAQHRTWCHLVRSTLDTATDASANIQLDDTTIAALAIALSDTHVRACCVAATARAHPGAERLWSYLTYAIPSPERATPALLFALDAYLRGDTPLARSALGIALDARPTDQFLRDIDKYVQFAGPSAHPRSVITTMAGSSPSCPEWNLSSTDTTEADDGRLRARTH